MGCGAQDDPFQIALPVAPVPFTAMQKLGEAHDTKPPPPDVACRVQDVPFHISAKAGLPPITSQKAADAQETLPRLVKVAPAGTGTDCTLHAVPFQVSASAVCAPKLLKAKPAASQNVGDVQETEDRTAELEPDGKGTGWIVHAAPFHDSARMTEALVPGVE
jgi:hypothetical protein